MLRALLLIALAQVAQPAPSQWDDAGRVSPIASLVAWDKGGSQDWGAGIPSPTIDCAATGTSSSASLQCSGATPSFAGTGQTAAGSPWWYRGDAAVRPAIALNGSTDYYTLGDVGDTASDAAGCVEFRPDALTGVTYLFGKTNNSTGPFGIYQSSGSLRVWVVKAGGGYTEVAFGTISVGTWYAACFGYDYVADGSSVLRTTLNGVAGTPSTTAVGPLEDTAHNLAIGAATNGTFKFAGAIRRVALWTGADAPTSAAQLAQMVATQWGLAADKPSGTVATHARTDSTLCCPFSDAECYWLGPGAPCIHAPTYQGWASGGAVAGGIEVYGPGANGGGYSEALNSWSESGTAAVSANSHAAPDLSVTMDTVTTTGANSIRYITDTVTSSAGPFTHAAWGRSVTGSAVGSIAVECYPQTVATCTCSTGRAAVGCTAEKVNSNFDCLGYATLDTTPTRVWVTATCSAAITQPVRLLGGGRWRTSDGSAVWWGSQITPTAYPVPYRSTPGASSYTGTASTATTLTVPVAPVGVTDASGAVAVTFTAASPIYPTAILGVGSDWLLIAAGATGARAFDGATEVPTFTVPDVTAGATLGVAWSGALQSLFVQPGGVVGSHAYDGAFVAGWVRFSIGARADGTYTNPGLYRRFAQCKRAGGCR